jgi:Raf kinase inhibitor-like YbhB/YbcL family protein
MYAFIRVRRVAAFGIASALVSLGLAGSIALAAPDKKVADITVTSSDLGRDSAHGFPDTYTLNAYGCTGGNQSPALNWSGAPAGTKSFIVTLYDPDDRDNPSGWWHWVAYDIPATTTSLLAGAGVEHSTKLPAGTRQGRSDLGKMAYHGPCPDKGDKPHRYTFTVYAIDVARLAVDEGASGAMVVETAQDHLLGKGTLVVTQSR